jgi:hypothetical protein
LPEGAKIEKGHPDEIKRPVGSTTMEEVGR